MCLIDRRYLEEHSAAVEDVGTSMPWFRCAESPIRFQIPGLAILAFIRRHDWPTLFGQGGINRDRQVRPANMTNPLRPLGLDRD